MIYLDTSALVKLVFNEAESLPFEEWLAERRDTPKFSSDLATIELLRTCRRVDERAASLANELLRSLDLLPVDRSVIDAAITIAPVELRSLDAIHVASARSVGDDLTALVAYDRRLCDAAASAGLTVVSPT